MLILQVYTFGAPRPGNRAFKEEYDQLIPDTWNIINDAVRILLSAPDPRRALQSTCETLC